MQSRRFWIPKRKPTGESVLEKLILFFHKTLCFCGKGAVKKACSLRRGGTCALYGYPGRPAQNKLIINENGLRRKHTKIRIRRRFAFLCLFTAGRSRTPAPCGVDITQYERFFHSSFSIVCREYGRKALARAGEVLYNTLTYYEERMTLFRNGDRYGKRKEKTDRGGGSGPLCRK